MLSARATETANDNRDELIARGLVVVRRIASRLARRLPPSVELDDLLSAGNEGLLRAVASYDPSRPEKFEGYAEGRIRGAILDELRAADSLTRYGRRKMTDVTRAIRKLEATLGAAPSEEQIAAELGISIDAYLTLTAELSRGLALSWLSEGDPDQVPGGETNPLTQLAAAEIRELLREAISALPERTQQVLALYYQHETTQSEIGAILGITESRVCQILGEALPRLRVKLKSIARNVFEE